MMHLAQLYFAKANQGRAAENAPLLPDATEKKKDANPAGSMTVDDVVALFDNVPETDQPYFVGGKFKVQRNYYLDTWEWCPPERKIRKSFGRKFRKSGQLRTRYIGWFSFGADRFWGTHCKSNLIR